MELNPKVNQMQKCIQRLISRSFIKICPAVYGIFCQNDRQTNMRTRIRAKSQFQRWAQLNWMIG